jgi:TP53 regulating kinase-like protein
MDASKMQLIGQGAEGKVYEAEFLSRPTIVKERVSKSYRVKELDQKLTLQRLRQEARCMVKCRKAGVLTPRYFWS